MRAGCVAVTIVLLVVFVLVAGFFFLVLLRDLDFAWQAPGPGPGPGPRPTPTTAPTPRPAPSTTPTPVPEDYLDHVGALNRFRRTEDGGDYVLSYGFIDHHGRQQQVICHIAQANYQRELAGFGYSDAEFKAHADAVLQQWIDQELASRGLSPYVHATVKDGYRWQSKFPALDSEQLSRLYVEIEKFRGWLETSYDRKRTEVRDAYLRKHGFTLEKDRKSVV